MNRILSGFLLCFSLTLGATGDSLHYLTRKDSVWLQFDETNEKFITHTLAKGQTLFSLSRFYGLTLAELYQFNPGLEGSTVQVGTQIRIPLPNAAIRRFRKNGKSMWNMLPLYYRVKPQDNLFNIAKRNFKMPVDTLIKRNRLSSATLSPGQVLHVGWISLKGIPDSLRNYSADPIWKKNYEMKDRFLAQGSRLTKEQGIAVWNPEQQGSEFYVLHRTARIGSIVTVNNPVTNRTAFAEVIGRIPSGSHGSEVKIILSKALARLLGAVDQRFFVKIQSIP